jgi:adenylylsulfate kinase
MKNINHTKSCVVFLTGLSGAGKTTIAEKLVSLLKAENSKPILLDGDDIRNALQITAFDEEARRKYNLSVGALASLFESQGHIVIVALIAPYADVRNQIKSRCQNFYEVYISTNVTVCMQRDPKGLYKKAVSGEIKNFTGVSAPYYAPENPALTIDTVNTSPDECARMIFNLLMIE